MAADSSSGSKPSSSTADSYIGSLISLTSKSEIRYEGVLYNINTEESTIGLINVRSFGTEGRKKDGPQVPPSDKDLQVKSSPPVQPTPPINHDPAIIQSHYPPPSSSLPSAVSRPLTDPSSHNSQLGLPGSTFQGGLPLYQPGGNIGSWGASPPPPTANGAGLAMPMYWQGYYGPLNGLPQLHQQSLLRPPPGLSMPPSVQQSMQYLNFNTPMLTGASNLPGSNMLDAPSRLLPHSTSSLNVASISLLSSTFPSALPPVPSATLSSETLPSSLPNKGCSPTLPESTFNASLPSLPPQTTSSLEINAVVTPTSDKPNAISVPVLPYQSSWQSMPSTVGSFSSISMEAPVAIPSLVTPGQLLQSGPSAVPPTQTASSSHSALTAHKAVQAVQVSSSPSEPSVAVVTEAQPPILPLPVPPQGVHKPNGAPFQSRHGCRGQERGRGTGSSHPVAKFTEDFDFMAMNEKFKKDEVWGHLGKGNKSHSKDKEGDGKISDEDDFEVDQDAGLYTIGVKPICNKDDFFDSISCNALDYESQNGRTRFSEQLKIDTETFGDFSRHQGGRGGHGRGRGRGRGRGGRPRGSYYGRGYGYVGRGWAHA